MAGAVASGGVVIAQEACPVWRPKLYVTDGKVHTGCAFALRHTTCTRPHPLLCAADAVTSPAGHHGKDAHRSAAQRLPHAAAQGARPRAAQAGKGFDEDGALGLRDLEHARQEAAACRAR